MPTPVDDHYANLLGPVYTWMVGDIDATFASSDAELDAMQLPTPSASMERVTAVDLGASHRQL